MKAIILAWAGFMVSAFGQVPIPEEVTRTTGMVFGSEEWKAERQKCTARLQAEFRSWMVTEKQLSEFRQVLVDYDSVAKEQDPVMYANPWKALYFARLERQRLLDEKAKEDAAKAYASAHWMDYVTNSVAREEEDGKQDEPESPIPPAIANHGIKALEGGKYQKRGNIIAVGGNFGSGYTISGDSLTKDGSVTHKRSGSMWMPVKQGEKQIYDP